MAYDKPELEYIWAEGGAVVEPSNTKKQLGWVAEVPPHQYENWVQRRQDQFIFHVNERGIPEWDGQTNYLGGGRSLVQGSNGGVYKSVAASGPTGVTQDPTTDAANTYWERAYPDNDDPRVVNAVPNSRQVNTGDGLSGGGNLTSNRTLSVDSSVVRTSRSITAGTGLSGGGNLSANRTLSVNYGTTAGTAAQGNDSRLSDAREWTAATVSQAEAEAGTSTSRRAWTAQRVRQAITSQFATAAEAQALESLTKLISPGRLGDALNAHVLGMGQTWQDVTASRTVGTTYTNTTGRPIQIFIAFDPQELGPHFLINNVNILPNDDNSYYQVACIVPDGDTYQLTKAGSTVQTKWLELR